MFFCFSVVCFKFCLFWCFGLFRCFCWCWRLRVLCYFSFRWFFVVWRVGSKFSQNSHPKKQDKTPRDPQTVPSKTPKKAPPPQKIFTQNNIHQRKKQKCKGMWTSCTSEKPVFRQCLLGLPCTPSPSAWAFSELWSLAWRTQLQAVGALTAGVGLAA